MITSKNRIDRRTLLRGAGGVAIGLPFLEAMLAPGRSHAASAVPLRFVVFYTPGGTLLDKWRPTGTETAYNLSDIPDNLSDLEDEARLLQTLIPLNQCTGINLPKECATMRCSGA
jgi:hypothetical protein